MDNSKTTKEDGCPHFAPSMGVEALHEYAEQSQQDKHDTEGHPDCSVISHMSTVFDLCVSLWGNLPGITGKYMFYSASKATDRPIILSQKKYYVF